MSDDKISVKKIIEGVIIAIISGVVLVVLTYYINNYFSNKKDDTKKDEIVENKTDKEDKKEEIKIKDGEITWETDKKGYFTDSRDSHKYKAVKIGTQTWMAENLAYLPSVCEAETECGYWVYDYNGINVTDAKATKNYKIYGVLYNWEKANEVCPTGWHLPSDAEWTVLTDYLGGEEVAGGKMKSTGTTYWESPNTDATNEIGFNGLPSGDRYTYDGGTFSCVGGNGNFWSSAYDASLAWDRSLYYNYARCTRYGNNMRDGFSVRCVKD